MALPVALGLFADGFTFRLGGLAMSHTVGGFADGHTFGAVFSFAGLIGTFDLLDMIMNGLLHTRASRT